MRNSTLNVGKFLNTKVRAVGAYIDLLQSISSPVPGDGAARFVSSLTGGAISPAEEHLDANVVARIPAATWNSLVSSICGAYIGVMGSIIGSGVRYGGSRREVGYTPEGEPVRTEQHLTPGLASEVYGLLLNGLRTLNDRDLEVTLRSLSERTSSEMLGFCRGMDPRPVNPPTPLLDDLMANQRDQIVADAMDRMGSYRATVLPLLKLFYCTAKIRSDDRTLPRELPVSSVCYDLKRTRITDATVAILPAPCPDMISTYAEPDAPIISNRALTYVSCILADDLSM